MHRAIEITVPPAATDALIEELEGVDGLIGLSVHRGASGVPPGDVLTVHALNRDADRIMRLAAAAHESGPISVATHELSSIVDPDKERAVANDYDEALWEEAETTLRHQGRVTTNYLILMALGGAVAATGFVVEKPSLAISIVAASVIAPGFEPLTKIPMGLVLRRWRVVGGGPVVGGRRLPGVGTRGGAGVRRHARDGRGDGGGVRGQLRDGAADVPHDA